MLRTHSFYRLLLIIFVAFFLSSFLITCAGKTRPTLKTKTNSNFIGNARSLFINTPINQSAQLDLGRMMLAKLNNHYSYEKRQMTGASLFVEKNIKKAHLYLQPDVISEIWQPQLGTLEWKVKLSLKENRTSRYFFNDLILMIKVRIPQDGKDYYALQKNILNKLTKALDSYFKNGYFPMSMAP